MISSRAIDTYGRFRIETTSCEICEGVYHDTVFAEIEKRHPEWRAGEKGRPIKKEYLKAWRASYQDSPKRMCFVFEADCQGDSITLCAGHLKEIVAKIEVQEEFFTMTTYPRTHRRRG